jgi:hypothetical protein
LNLFFGKREDFTLFVRLVGGVVVQHFQDAIVVDAGISYQSFDFLIAHYDTFLPRSVTSFEENATL